MLFSGQRVVQRCLHGRVRLHHARLGFRGLGLAQVHRARCKPRISSEEVKPSALFGLPCLCMLVVVAGLLQRVGLASVRRAGWGRRLGVLLRLIAWLGFLLPSVWCFRASRPNITLKWDAPFRSGFEGLLFFRLQWLRLSSATGAPLSFTLGGSLFSLTRTSVALNYRCNCYRECMY